MRCITLLVALLLLNACASPEGPGSLATVNPVPQQQTQTAPLPGAVSAQTLAAPGTQSATPQPLQTAQPGAILTTPSSLEPGTLSRNPTQQSTLQDFSRTNPGQITTDDPFGTQRGQILSLPETTSQETLQDAIQTGLQQPSASQAPASAASQWPRVSLAPISTAPEPQATQLFDAIDDAAFSRGMQFAFFGDETAHYVIRSQVSAIPADQVTSIIYVFDIFDARGTLRHRVSGARTIPRSGPDGWALVDQSTTQLIAEDVAGRMMAWLQQNPS